MKTKFQPQNPLLLTDAEIDELCLSTGTYDETASEETRAEWRAGYRKVEANSQIERHGSIEAWYSSGEGRD